MSGFGRHGPIGGGGVRPTGGQPGRPGSRPGDNIALQPNDTLEHRWPNYLQGGYFDDHGNLKIEYVARCLPGDENLPDTQQHGVERFVLAMAHGTPKLTTGQLRRFFQHCRGLETRLKSGSATWPQLRAQFQFLDAAATDAFGKQPPKIPDVFYDFIRRNVAAVKWEKDFREGFLPHFEALVGFASLHLPKDRN